MYKRFVAVLVALCALASVAHAQGTLYDRLGGERILSGLVDDWYARLVADPQLSDRFGGPDKAYLKNQYLAYFETMTGGPHNYHGPTVVTVHRHLRVTEDEWNLTIEHMRESLTRFQVNPRAQKEFINDLLALHNDIVRDPNAPQANRSLYDRMGGEPVLRAVIDDYFNQLINDPNMSDRFTGTNLAAIKGEVLEFLGQATGGPQVYHGQDMKSVHWRMHITAEEWDTTIRHLQAALDRNHVAPQEATELLGIIQQSRSQIVHDH